MIKELRKKVLYLEEITLFLVKFVYNFVDYYMVFSEVFLQPSVKTKNWLFNSQTKVLKVQ